MEQFKEANEIFFWGRVIPICAGWFGENNKDFECLLKRPLRKKYPKLANFLPISRNSGILKRMAFKEYQILPPSQITKSWIRIYQPLCDARPRNSPGIPQEFPKDSGKLLLRFEEFGHSPFRVPQEQMLNVVQTARERPKTCSVFIENKFLPSL